MIWTVDACNFTEQFVHVGKLRIFPVSPNCLKSVLTYCLYYQSNNKLQYSYEKREMIQFMAIYFKMTQSC